MTMIIIFSVIFILLALGLIMFVSKKTEKLYQSLLSSNMLMPDDVIITATKGAAQFGAGVAAVTAQSLVIAVKQGNIVQIPYAQIAAVTYKNSVAVEGVSGAFTVTVSLINQQAPVTFWSSRCYKKLDVAAVTRKLSASLVTEAGIVAPVANLAGNIWATHLTNRNLNEVRTSLEEAQQLFGAALELHGVAFRPVEG